MRKKEGRIEHQQKRQNLNCRYCGLLFKNQANLSRHRKSHQVRKTKHKRCKCICGQYITMNNINKHSQSKKHLAGVDF